jgi:hypothetical protein
MAPTHSATSTRAHPRWPLGAAAGVAAILAVFFAPALLGAGDFVYRDTGRMHAPMKRWIGEELARGRLPQWNPYSGLGTPVVANAVDAAQHPFNLLLFTLPPGAALSAWILFSFALAAAGAFAWARVARCSGAACGVAAIAFALSGPLVSSSDNVTYLTTYAALPWMFAAAHRHAERGGPLGLALVGLTSALCAAAGDPQAWAIALALLPAYVIAIAPPATRRTAAVRALGALVAGALAAAPFVLPVLEWTPYTSRSGGIPADQAVRWNVHPRRLLELTVPELLRGDPADPISPLFIAYAGNDATQVPWFLSLYLGASVVALAALGAAIERRARLLALAAILFAWAALGHYAGFTSIAARLPVLRFFRYWEKLAIWLPLLLAIPAAAGVDALLSGRGARALARGTAVAAGFLLAMAGVAALSPGAVAAVAGGPPGAAAALAGNLASGAGRAGAVLALLALAAAATARGKLERLAPLALAALVALDLCGGNAGAYVLGPRERIGRPPLAASLAPGERVLSPFSPRDDRWPGLGRLGNMWEWSRRTLDASWNVPIRIGLPHDYVGLREARWAGYRNALGEGTQSAELGLYGFAHLVVPGDPSLAAKAGISVPARVEATDPDLPAWLVAIPHRPRAYVAERVSRASESEAFAFAFAGGTAGRTVVEGPLPPGGGDGSGAARIVRDDPGDTAVEVRADGPALLVLNDALVPGWTAEVDGRPTAIQRANYLVRGVWIEAGSHAVRFRYRTPGLAAGWGVALAFALMLCAWPLFRRLRRGPMAPDAVRGNAS